MVVGWGHTGPGGARRVHHEIDSFSYKNENCQKGSRGVRGGQRGSWGPWGVRRLYVNSLAHDTKNVAV